ncbi:MAG: acylphosphatase [Candidatus Altiarchaeota archaeon]|nr:acylphosphatase [Candidatus Altiarchaeota archaeon]
MERVVVTVGGRVQRVGYRDYVVELATELNVNGTVENLDDGKVRIVAEAEKGVLDRFVESLKAPGDPMIRVLDVDTEFRKATGEFRYFDTKYGDFQKEGFERIGDAARILKHLSGGQDQMLDKQDQMLDKQDQMLDKQDQMLDKQDKTIDIIGEGNRMLAEKIDSGNEKICGKLDEFHRDTSRRFDVIDLKYGKIAENMEEAIRAINRTCDNTEMLLEKSERDRGDFRDSMKGLTDAILKLAEKR